MDYHINTLGYKYENESDAIEARKQCADYYGLPKSPEDTTKYWVNYNFAEYNTPQFWYIFYDASLDPILGDPEYLKIILPPFGD